jgi:hypothetical protein
MSHNSRRVSHIIYAISVICSTGRLQARSDGSCVLLDRAAKTCSVWTVRPTLCATYPFWRNNISSEVDWLAAAADCEGIDTKSNRTRTQAPGRQLPRASLREAPELQADHCSGDDGSESPIRAFQGAPQAGDSPSTRVAPIQVRSRETPWTTIPRYTMQGLPARKCSKQHQLTKATCCRNSHSVAVESIQCMNN